jgi:arginine/ornithine N-succinyltransferase beta subunit
MDQLRAWCDSRCVACAAGPEQDAPLALVATVDRLDFRVIAARTAPQGGTLILPEEQLRALGCGPGAPVRTMALEAMRVGAKNNAGPVANVLH